MRRITIRRGAQPQTELALRLQCAFAEAGARTLIGSVEKGHIKATARDGVEVIISCDPGADWGKRVDEAGQEYGLEGGGELLASATDWVRTYAANPRGDTHEAVKRIAKSEAALETE